MDGDEGIKGGAPHHQGQTPPGIPLFDGANASLRQ